MVFGCCTKKRKQFRNLTKSTKTPANVQASSFKKTITKSTTPAKSGSGYVSGPRQEQPAKGQQKINFLKKPSSIKSATAKASATKGKFKVKDSKAAKKQDSSIKKSSSASSKSKKSSSISKQTSATTKPFASAKAPAAPKKTPEEKVKAGKSPKQFEREREKTRKRIPPPGSTVDSFLLPFVDKIESTERVNVPTKADLSPHQAPPFVYASIADPRHPQQQLIVSSFMTGGRRVKRWTYADSYPADQMPPPSLGAMLAASPVCSREDCGLTVMEPVGMVHVPSFFSKNRQKVKKDGEQIKKKDREEMINSAKKNLKSDGSARVPECHSALSRDTSLTFSRTENVRTSSMTNVSEKGVAERHLSEEAVRKKLLESAQLLQQAISKMNEVRYRENDDSLYETSLYKVQKCEKKVDRIAHGLSAVVSDESKTNQQKKGELRY